MGIYIPDKIFETDKKRQYIALCKDNGI